jgi:YD repeat-containing protein
MAQLITSFSGPLKTSINTLDDGTGNVSIGLAAPLWIMGTRRYVSVQGSADAGVYEMSTSAADASGNVVGVVQWTDKNSVNSTDKRVANIGVSLQGTTANNRGGQMNFATKADGGNLAVRFTIDKDGKVYTPNNTLDSGSGSVIFGGGNQSTFKTQALEINTDTRSVTLGYDAYGNLTTITEKDAGTTVSTTTLNYTNGMITSVVQVAGGNTITTTLSYDSAGNLTGTTKTVT